MQFLQQDRISTPEPSTIHRRVLQHTVFSHNLGSHPNGRYLLSNNNRISGWPDFVPGGISIWCGPSTMGLQSRGGSRGRLEDQSIVQNISQIYPLWFRSTGVSISTGFNWSLNLIVTFTFPYLQQVGWKICYWTQFQPPRVSALVPTIFSLVWLLLPRCGSRLYCLSLR